MIAFLVSFVAIIVMMLLMAVGVLFGREPLKGTCGGLNRFTGDKECPVCGGDTTKCETLNSDGQPEDKAGLGRDVMKKS
jgi:uncharacterized protein